jgi:hypothetical protein
MGIIDAMSVGMKDFFKSNFVILQTGFYFFECFNVHNFSRLFNYNERISFEEFAQPRDTVNLDVSHRQDDHQASPSVQELKGGHDEDENDREEEIQAGDDQA